MKEISLAQLNFADHIRPDDFVAWGQASAEPLSLTETLVEQRHEIGGRFTAFVGIAFAETALPEHADIIDFVSYCGAGANRRLAKAGVLEVLPSHYSAMSSWLAESVDVLLLQLAPTDNPEQFSFGLGCDYFYSAIQTARMVIAEVSDALPSTYSDWKVDAKDIDVLVRTSRAPATPPQTIGSPTDQRIAAHVAELTPDGATVQVGLGALPNQILRALSAHKDLGIHSGQISDGLVELIKADVVTNSRKPRDVGASVAGMIAVSLENLSFLNNNAAIKLAPTAYTHDHSVLASLPRFTAINSALEVDLFGQVNGETAGEIFVGAIGGGTDFLRGASSSEGGLPIIALASSIRSKDGTLRSRIAPWLSGPSSISRADAGVIVTEYGAADLRGKTDAQRRDAMLAIAHPDLREGLARAAHSQGRRGAIS